MNFLEQYFISFDLIAFFCCDSGKIQFYEILNCMSSVSKSPIKCIKSTTKIDYLAFVFRFLKFEIRTIFFYLKNIFFSILSYKKVKRKKRSRSKKEFANKAHLKEFFNTYFDAFNSRIISSIDFWSFS